LTRYDERLVTAAYAFGFSIHTRDELHRNSILSAAATGVIAGLGPYGYIVGAIHLRTIGKLPAVPPAPISFGPRWKSDEFRICPNASEGPGAANRTCEPVSVQR